MLVGNSVPQVYLENNQNKYQNNWPRQWKYKKFIKHKKLQGILINVQKEKIMYSFKPKETTMKKEQLENNEDFMEIKNTITKIKK